MNALDVLRVLDREPAAVEAVLGEIRLASGADRRLDAAVTALERDLTPSATAGAAVDRLQRTAGARLVVERLATTLQASLLVRHAPPAVADGYLATRVAGTGGSTFGTLPAGLDVRSICARALP